MASSIAYGVARHFFVAIGDKKNNEPFAAHHDDDRRSSPRRTATPSSPTRGIASPPNFLIALDQIIFAGADADFFGVSKLD